MVTQQTVKEALDILRGAVTIVYPMGLPPHENIKMEFENNEDLSGTQVCRCFCTKFICIVVDSTVVYHFFVNVKSPGTSKMFWSKKYW